MPKTNKHIRVNFLRDRKRKVRRERLLFAKIQTVALVILGVYSVLLFALLGLKQASVRRLNQVEDSIAQEETALKRLAPVEAMAIVVGNKLNLLKDFYRDNLAVREAMMQLYTALPEGVEVSSLSFGDAKDSVSVDGQARSVFVVETLLPTLRQWWNDKQYDQITFNGFNRGLDASYRFSGEFVLGEKAPKLVDLLEKSNE